MQKSQSWMIARDDTILGVCQALGEDFGINPLWLRIGFAVPVLFNPILAIGAYLAVGTAVLVSRLLAPDPRRAMPAEEWPETETEATQGELALESAGGNDNSEELAAAA